LRSGAGGGGSDAEEPRGRRGGAIRAFAKQLNVRHSEAQYEDTLNPLSRNYVGPEEHRRIVEATHGKFKKKGSPTTANVERALPGQVATLLNVLTFVDALNAIFRRGLVETPAEGAATYEALIGWAEGALQARFSGAAQYLKAARKYGLVHFDGEIPLGCLITSRSLQRTRHQLLASVLTRPKLIGASMEGKELVRRVLGPEFEVQIAAYTKGTFEELFPKHAPTASLEC